MSIKPFNYMLAMYVLWIAAMILLAGCPLVEVKVVNTSIMDKGDNTADNYTKGNDAMTDEEILNLEAELVK